MQNKISLAVKALQQGGVIIYPTEAVYGIGCDPYNEKAVQKLLAIKQRSVEHGLILLIDNWRNIMPLINLDYELDFVAIENNPVKNITWLFPASNQVPSWITGKHDQVAIRSPDHHLAKKICAAFKGPIVSTSANITGKPACTSYTAVINNFNDLRIDYIVDSPVGSYQQPSTIIDYLTREVIR